jgi:hypothetical protein
VESINVKIDESYVPNIKEERKNPNEQEIKELKEEEVEEEEEKQEEKKLKEK